MINSNSLIYMLIFYKARSRKKIPIIRNCSNQNGIEVKGIVTSATLTMPAAKCQVAPRSKRDKATAQHSCILVQSSISLPSYLMLPSRSSSVPVNFSIESTSVSCNFSPAKHARHFISVQGTRNLAIANRSRVSCAHYIEDI